MLIRVHTDCDSEAARECVRRCKQCIGQTDASKKDADGKECKTCEACSKFVHCANTNAGKSTCAPRVCQRVFERGQSCTKNVVWCLNVRKLHEQLSCIVCDCIHAG